MIAFTVFPIIYHKNATIILQSSVLHLNKIILSSLLKINSPCFFHLVDLFCEMS